MVTRTLNFIAETSYMRCNKQKINIEKQSKASQRRKSFNLPEKIILISDPYFQHSRYRKQMEAKCEAHSGSSAKLDREKTEYKNKNEGSEEQPTFQFTRTALGTIIRCGP